MPQDTLLLFDLDGVVQFDRRVDAGAAALLDELRQAGYVLRFLTNDGFHSRRSRLAEMHADGLHIELDELYTASSLAARYVAAHGPTFALVGDLAAEEFAELPQDAATARTVVVGDWFHHYDFERLQLAFEAAQRGAEMVAVHRKRAWTHRGRRLIDVGFFVAGLEHCTGRPATVVGKPAAYAYQAVLEDAGFPPERTVMISDEPEPDLHGAQALGLRTLWFDNGEEDGGTFAPHDYNGLRRVLLDGQAGR